jgi:hypothetical protein
MMSVAQADASLSEEEKEKAAAWTEHFMSYVDVSLIISTASAMQVRNKEVVLLFFALCECVQHRSYFLFAYVWLQIAPEAAAASSVLPTVAPKRSRLEVEALAKAAGAGGG